MEGIDQAGGAVDAASESAAKRPAWHRAAWLAAVYALLGALWIIGSDSALNRLVPDPETVARLQTWKGWFYVATTALLLFSILYRLLRNDARRLKQQVRQRNDLRTLSQFRESVIDNASIWINVLDAQARVTVWNKAAEQISGYRKEEVLGHAGIWAQLYPDEAYRNDITARVMAILNEGLEVEGFETRIRARDGQYKIISWNSRRFFDKDGELGSIAIGQDVTDRKRMQEELEWVAAHDPLTNLYNRRKFEQLAARRHDACARDGRAFAMLWIDIDGFKCVNDRFGHRVGDEALQQIGAMLGEEVGQGDIAARYGGDELVVALPGSDAEAALALAERLRRRVHDANLLAAQAGGSGPTVSIGVAASGKCTESLDSLGVAADKAMYRAKSGGRNRVCGPLERGAGQDDG